MLLVRFIIRNLRRKQYSLQNNNYFTLYSATFLPPLFYKTTTLLQPLPLAWTLVAVKREQGRPLTPYSFLLTLVAEKLDRARTVQIV